MANLNDIKGYRAKPINALNAAVRRARIIGGDVTAEESEAGTRLFIERAYPQSRFDLFFGLAELEEGKLEPTLCIGDGAFFVNGDVIILKNATNVKYCPKGIRPRSSGWASKGAPEKGSSGNAWSKCEVLILYYGEEYYIAFRYDDMELYKLISEDATEDIESAIEIVLNIGSFKFSDSSIVQNVNSDIFYNTDKVAELLPWDIINRNGVYYIVEPKWVLNEPTVIDKDLTPKPKESTDHPEADSEVFNNTTCYPLEDMVVYGKDNKYLHAFAVIKADGSYGLALKASRNALKEVASCVYLGRFERDKEDDTKIIGWKQSRRGIIESKWNETEPYFVESNSSGNKRHPEAPVGLDEGTTMFRYRFWILRTTIGGALYREDENLNYDENSGFEKEQKSLEYGHYIWRHQLYFDYRSKSLLVDNITTAVLNVEVSTFASLVPTPYVQRIEVTYPESPLAQGSVDAVGGTIQVLAVQSPQESRTPLFKTESIDATDGGIIEVEDA